MKPEPQRHICIDTSLYLGILLGEKKALPYQKTLAHKSLCASTLLLIEAERNLVRLSRSGILKQSDFHALLERLKEDVALFVFKHIDMGICLTAQFPPVALPRSADLVHLRTALWFQQRGQLELFLTLDNQQQAAAKELGLPCG